MKMLPRLLLLTMTILTLYPAQALAEESNYFVLRPGALFMSDFSGEHPSAFWSELVYGRRLFPGLAVEAGAGYFHDGVSQGNEIAGIPVTVTLKAVYAAGPYEFYAGGGGGAFIVTKYKGVLDGVSVDDGDTVPEGHLVIGANYGFSSRFFVGLEGRYVFTGTAELGGAERKLDGLVTAAAVGLRF